MPLTRNSIQQYYLAIVFSNSINQIYTGIVAIQQCDGPQAHAYAVKEPLPYDRSRDNMSVIDKMTSKVQRN